MCVRIQNADAGNEQVAKVLARRHAPVFRRLCRLADIAAAKALAENPQAAEHVLAANAALRVMEQAGKLADLEVEGSLFFYQWLARRPLQRHSAAARRQANVENAQARELLGLDALDHGDHSAAAERLFTLADNAVLDAAQTWGGEDDFPVRVRLDALRDVVAVVNSVGDLPLEERDALVETLDGLIADRYDSHFTER